MPPHGITNDEDDQEKLDQDYSPPFSAPDGVKDTTDSTHPEADTNVDPMEHYDEGISGATETDDPGNRGITDYTPSSDDDDEEDEDEEEDKEEE